MYRIGKRFTFQAAHELPTIGTDEGCGSGLHGHTFAVEVTLTAEQLAHPGFVVDFAELAPVGHHIAERLDHQLLNDVLAEPPTHQVVSRYLRDWLHTHGQFPDRVTIDTVTVVAPARPELANLPSHHVTFEAAHRLPGLPVGHKCARTHGHSYLGGLILPDGAELTDSHLQPLREYIATTFDRHFLNDTVPVAGPPTSENLARHLHDWSARHLPLPVGVDLTGAWVSETASTWAEYRPTRS